MRALEVENPRRCTKIESLQQPANKAKSFGLGLGEGALRSRISGEGLGSLRANLPGTSTHLSDVEPLGRRLGGGAPKYPHLNPKTLNPINSKPKGTPGNGAQNPHPSMCHPRAADPTKKPSRHRCCHYPWAPK